MTASSEPAPLALSRLRRSTAGARMGALINAEIDDDLALLFAEDEEDEEFELEAASEGGSGAAMGEDEEEEDVMMSSSSSDEEETDKGPNAQDDDFEGEKELQQQARLDAKKKKKKAGENLRLTALRKRAMASSATVRQKAAKQTTTEIDAAAARQSEEADEKNQGRDFENDGSASRASPALSSDTMTSAELARKRKKKSDRISWLPSASIAPQRSSSRRQTMANKQQTHERLQSSEAKRLRLLAIMEAAAKRKEKTKRPAKTQADRLAEAVRTEQLNSRSLNTWEETERRRVEEREARLRALQERRLEGAVVTFWSGKAVWIDGRLVKVGEIEIKAKEVEKEEGKKRKAKDGGEGRGKARKGEDGKAIAAAPVQAPGFAEESAASPLKTFEQPMAGPSGEASDEQRPAQGSQQQIQPGSVPAHAAQESAQKPLNTEAQSQQDAEKLPASSSAAAELGREAGQNTSAVPEQTRMDDNTQPAPIDTTTNPSTVARPQTASQSTLVPYASTEVLSHGDSMEPKEREAMAQANVPQHASAAEASGQADKEEKPTEICAADNGRPLPQPTPAPLPTEQSTPAEPASAAPADLATPTPAFSPEIKDTQTLDTPIIPSAPPIEETTSREAYIFTDFDTHPSVEKSAYSIFFPSKTADPSTNITSTTAGDHPSSTRPSQSRASKSTKSATTAKQAPIPLCPITSHPARYRDPLTQLAYASTLAYREIHETLRNRYAWSSVLGCFCGPIGVGARGVPERFLAPNTVPKDVGVDVGGNVRGSSLTELENSTPAVTGVATPGISAEPAATGKSDKTMTNGGSDSAVLIQDSTINKTSATEAVPSAPLPTAPAWSSSTPDVTVMGNN
ncbi:hypothetical protein KEM55_007949 [Ascosphaera atra]|nr:hypothetical protein KEM55_007949 [Ascosphaera atra]